MARENFKISCSNGTEVIKHAWNASRREVESIVRTIARKEETIYNLTDSQAEKVDSYHVRGMMQWTGNNGNVLTFTIEKLWKK